MKTLLNIIAAITLTATLALGQTTEWKSLGTIPSTDKEARFLITGKELYLVSFNDKEFTEHHKRGNKWESTPAFKIPEGKYLQVKTNGDKIFWSILQPKQTCINISQKINGNWETKVLDANAPRNTTIATDWNNKVAYTDGDHIVIVTNGTKTNIGNPKNSNHRIDKIGLVFTPNGLEVVWMDQKTLIHAIYTNDKWEVKSEKPMDIYGMVMKLNDIETHGNDIVVSLNTESEHGWVNTLLRKSTNWEPQVIGSHQIGSLRPSKTHWNKTFTVQFETSNGKPTLYSFDENWKMEKMEFQTETPDIFTTTGNTYLVQSNKNELTVLHK